MATYKIIRKFQNEQLEDVVILRGLTLDEAQRHCSDLETSSFTCKDPAKLEYTKVMGNWFDSYHAEEP